MRNNWNALLMLVRAEVIRCSRIWVQSFIPPAITMALYFVIFGHIIGRRMGEVSGFPYIVFLTPGLIMMSVLSSSFMQASSSVYGRKFSRAIDELLISPMPSSLIVLGILLGCVFRSLIIACLVTAVARLFVPVPVHHFFVLVYTFLITTCLFGLIGIINGSLAKNFDDISWIPSFVIAPLSYTGGVFYSINLLPPFWNVVSHFNPVYYIISAFRFSMLGVTGGHHFAPILVMLGVLTTILFVVAVNLFQHSTRLRY